MELPSPRYPLTIDASLAASGKPVFAQHCASCHAPGGARTGTVVPIGEIGTDRASRRTCGRRNPRRPSMPSQTATHGTSRRFGKPTGTSRCRSTASGCAGRISTTVRSRSLHDLLEPIQNRPKAFFRGYDLLDPVRVGFVSDGPVAERMGTRHDTGLPGNGNGGHLYGTDLTSVREACPPRVFENTLSRRCMCRFGNQ